MFQILSIRNTKKVTKTGNTMYIYSYQISSRNTVSWSLYLFLRTRGMDNNNPEQIENEEEEVEIACFRKKNLVDPASLLRNRHEPKTAMTIPPMKRPPFKGVRIRSRVLRAPRKKPRRFRDSSKWVQPRRLWPLLLPSLEFPTSKLHDNSNKNRSILRSDRRIVNFWEFAKIIINNNNN